jgi:hypothetical protein
MFFGGRIGPFVMLGCKPRQIRKEAAVVIDACQSKTGVRRHLF